MALVLFAESVIGRLPTRKQAVRLNIIVKKPSIPLMFIENIGQN